ncbi:MAG: arginyltransferase, partial [Myxococcales bacterium]|nr:arginyltransferase [Myxococcales bacterium]
FPHPSGREATFHDDAAGGRIVGVGLFDETPSALSAAFFFHDPDYAQFSLGTANVLALFEEARASGRQYVYLGYRVEGCASLAYKSRFRPHELLAGRPLMNETPSWRTAGDPEEARAISPGPRGR